MSDRATPVHHDITFKEHYRYFEKELLITGTNLSIGKTVLFSHAETPNFPIADAVRISMSLPFIYKPYVITEVKEGWTPCGTYVDGGVWNNLPFREFDGKRETSDNKEPLGSTNSPVKQGGTPFNSRIGSNGPLLDSFGIPKQFVEETPAKTVSSTICRAKTLGLRLELAPAANIESFGELVARIANFGLFGSGETQVLSRYEEQMILLDTRGLDLIDFKPDPADRDRAIKRARRETWRYFNESVPGEDLDEVDDRATESLRSKTSLCG